MQRDLTEPQRHGVQTTQDLTGFFCAKTPSIADISSLCVFVPPCEKMRYGRESVPRKLSATCRFQVNELTFLGLASGYDSVSHSSVG